MSVVSDDEHLSLEHQLCVALNRAARAINGRYRPSLNRIGLTYRQYTVMLVLWEQGTTTLGDLADLLGLDSGTLSPLVKRMAEAGLLTRRRNPRDERVLDLEITEFGRSLREAATAAQREVEASTRLSDEEFADLRRRLIELTSSLRDGRDTQPA